MWKHEASNTLPTSCSQSDGSLIQTPRMPITHANVHDAFYRYLEGYLGTDMAENIDDSTPYEKCHRFDDSMALIQLILKMPGHPAESTAKRDCLDLTVGELISQLHEWHTTSPRIKSIALSN
jgi:hypothetical protein